MCMEISGIIVSIVKRLLVDLIFLSVMLNYMKYPEGLTEKINGPDGMMVKPPTVFRGENAIDEFLRKLLDEEKLILDTLRYVKPMVFSPTDEENYQSSTQCSICEKPLNGDANYYKIDPCHTCTAPGLAWQACLKMTKVRLELLTDIDMQLFIGKGILGDANNLYGWAMSQNLPTHDFFWTDVYANFMDVPDDSDVGYIFEVDLEYPDELHDLHNCYPLAPEKIEYVLIYNGVSNP
ncbi:uncharacterized protein NPIL_285251 [Nephila pilipes]|uniref:Uncharacterized protein n=1 Tax=Nephila pilipes TaxID=299642 RepID=A0A8X6UHH5_NEPPI|nr:uncharacterized protein NPIL_285251 [Nephila pilipes]